jgi:excisionase family DNA binding protein
MKQKAVLTPVETAKILRLSLPTVYRELNNGTIPSVKVGARFLISRTRLDRWLEGEKSGN